MVGAGRCQDGLDPWLRGASRSLELRKLLSHQGLLEQAGAHGGWDPGFPASSGSLKPRVLPGSAGPAGTRVSQGPALNLYVTSISFFPSFQPVIAFPVVDIPKTILPLSLSYLTSTLLFSIASPFPMSSAFLSPSTPQRSPSPFPSFPPLGYPLHLLSFQPG